MILKTWDLYFGQKTVSAIRRMNPNTTLETLIPDFQGNKTNLDRILKVSPEVISHNMETVKRLTREVRIQAKYERSLEVLNYLKKQGAPRTKSGIMLGFGRNRRGSNSDNERFKRCKS